MSLKRIAIALTCLLASQATGAQSTDVQRSGIERIKLENEDFGYFFSDSQWPGNADGRTIIPVCWEGNTLSTFAKETKWVEEAAKSTWQEHSQIVFTGWLKCAERNSGIRIVAVDTGARVIAFGKHLNQKKDGMELNFSFLKWNPGCSLSEGARERCIRSIAVHEFGHAIGFAHEQDRADTPGECAQKKGTGTTGPDLVALTPYDPESAMNYCNPTSNNAGKLSARDIQSVQQKYGAPTK